MHKLKMYGLMCYVKFGLIADSKFGFKNSASTLWPGLMLGQDSLMPQRGTLYGFMFQ